MEAIRGVLFHVKGSELSSLMTARSVWHAKRVEELQSNREVAVKALDDASRAASLAGRARGGRPVPRIAVARVALAAAGPSRNYGEDMEDPVSAIDSAIEHHSSRAVALKFYAEHLLLDQVYILQTHEIDQFELLGTEEE